MNKFTIIWYYSDISRWSNHSTYQAASKAQAKLLFMAEHGVGRYIWNVLKD